MSEISKTASRLYRAAEELRDVRGQSAVARLLGVSPQVMKNWELRDVSEGGALLAQKHIGCDANWILGHHTEIQKTIKSVPQTTNEAREQTHEYSATVKWPFTTVRESEWLSIPKSTRDIIEQQIKSLIPQNAANEQAA